MALDTSSLESAIINVFLSSSGEIDEETEARIRKASKDLANAIEVFVKTATVNTTVETTVAPGITTLGTSPSGPTTGATTGVGKGTGSGKGTLS